MKLKDFFNSELVRLPRGGFDETRETFDQFLAELLGQYVTGLRSVDDPEFPEMGSESADLAAAAEDLAGSIVTSVGFFLAGHVHVAYQEMSDCLSRVDWTQFRSELSEDKDEFNLSDPFSPYLHAVRNPPLYRIRSDRSEFTIPNRADIFHVPFEKRRMVNNQRYSIAGLPCLYLGSSLWICWEELGRPPLDSIWVSRFRIVEPVSVLDFQFPPHHVWRLFEALREGTPKASERSSEGELKKRFNTEFLKSYLVCWPLIAACSVRPESRSGPFVPEYIVPQLLLQWVAQENNVDGIRYFSARMPSEGMHILAHSNCVFPVKIIAFCGHCAQLRREFALTEPLSWEALTATNLGSSSIITNRSSNAFAPIQMNRDLLLQYSQTAFFEVEMKLEKIEATSNHSRVMGP